MLPFEKNSEKIVNLILNANETGKVLGYFEKFQIENNKSSEFILFSLVTQSYKQITLRMNKDTIDTVPDLQKILLINHVETAEILFDKLSNQSNQISRETYLDFLSKLEKETLQSYFNNFFDFKNTEPNKKKDMYTDKSYYFLIVNFFKNVIYFVKKACSNIFQDRRDFGMFLKND